MRTKTLLIAAAALAAGVISSQAQTVYSQNIVGYVNLALTPGADELVAPALDYDGTGTNGTISTLIGTNVVSGTEVLVWNGSGYNILTYSVIPGSPRGTAPTWYTLVGGVNTSVPNYPINVGTGFFINDPTDTNITETGIVFTGSNGTVTNSLPAGADSLVASEIPFGGDIATNLDYVPTSGDEVLIWNGGGYNIYTYSVIPGSPRGTLPVWYTSVGGVNTAQDPVIPVGQGFFIVPAAANSWTETLTNN